VKKNLILAAIFLLFAVAGCNLNTDSGGGGNSGNVTKSYPVFSPIGGFYKEAQPVTISHNSATAIYYTTDLSEPTENSTKYTGPFTVSNQCIVRALAIQSDGTKSYAMTCYDFDTNRATDAGSHESSPVWRDQVIYFLMLDRFYNGDTSNDNQNIKYADGSSYNENEPISGQPVSGYNGGDFKGVEDKLDYIKSLGATAIWITPPVRNQVSEGAYHGYHGYWASDFCRTDPHFGTLEDYQNLVKAAHQKGLYVIQDIVVNHTGDYMKGDGTVTAEMVADKNIPQSVFYLNPKSVGLNDASEWMHPEQLPWKFNDPSKFTADEFTSSSFYNYNPSISNFNDPSQTYTYQESGLDDIKTTNPVVRNLLRGYFRYWIDKVDIDGYRIDTALYVEPEFFEGFINGTESDNMGVKAYAATLGKSDFLDFGEAWTANESTSVSYTVDKTTGNKRMDSVIYFPLTMALRDAVSSGSSGTSELSTVLKKRYAIGYDDPNRLVTFVDNHDMERLITIAPEEMVKAAYSLIMTVPGIPQLYYGVEQGFTTTRRAMFAGGYKGLSGNTREVNDSDCFTESGDWYDFIKDIIALRKNNKVFRYNGLKVLKDTESSPGLFAYGLQGTDENGTALTGAGCRAFFVMNTANTEQLLNITPTNTNLRVGDKFARQQPSSSGCQTEFTVETGNVIQMLVPAYSYAIYLLTEEGTEVPVVEHTIEITSSFTTANTVISGNEITVEGTATDTGSVKMVFNNDYSNAQNFTISSAGNFSFTASLTGFSNGTVSVELEETLADSSVIYSNVKKFTILRPFTKLDSACITDPSNDDTGPAGYSYTKPDGFDGPLDIEGVDVATSGNDIQLTVKMRSVSREWNPTTNLFDHVMFSIFFEKPDSTAGCSVQPNQNYTLPAGFKWDYMLKAYGWSTSFYNSTGASATANGTSVTPAPTSAVVWPDDATVKMQSPGTITFTIKSASLGYPSSLNGWKIYMNTYDMDFDQLRGMVSEDEFDSSKYAFSCGTADPATAPKVIDETSIITLTTE
jgi:glycosidase